jgi:adenine C2-methylase RlmN of 23S rRNA A2503 and tRNA A37
MYFYSSWVRHGMRLLCHRQLGTPEICLRAKLSTGVIFYRNLAEISKKLPNVMMGMGEPFHNYDAMMEAIDRLNHKQGSISVLVVLLFLRWV